LDNPHSFALNIRTVQPAIRVELHPAVIRSNIARIVQETKVPVIAVVKADAYGLGLRDVIPAIDDLVAGYYLFQPREVIATAGHRLTRKSFIAAWCDDSQVDELLSHRIRPAAWSVDQAMRWRSCDPVLAVDTGQQRFACPPEQIDAVLAAGGCREAFTHASSVDQARHFQAITAGRSLVRHAAGSSLLEIAEARFDAVRPGFALYRGSVRVTTHLIDARDSRGPAGYTGFIAPRHGVIPGGYSNGLAAGVCMVNGTRRRILEIGMQTAFVELGPTDRAGDEVTLLGDGLTEDDVAKSWGCGRHEALYRLARCGIRVQV